jgi:hypothetical protein
LRALLCLASTVGGGLYIYRRGALRSPRLNEVRILPAGSATASTRRPVSACGSRLTADGAHDPRQIRCATRRFVVSPA